VAIEFLKLIGHEKVNNPRFKNTQVSLRLVDEAVVYDSENTKVI